MSFHHAKKKSSQKQATSDHQDTHNKNEVTSLPDMDLILQRAESNPTTLSQGEILQLQHTLGNRAVSQLLSKQENKNKSGAVIQRVWTPITVTKATQLIHKDKSPSDPNSNYGSPITEKSEIVANPEQSKNLEGNTWIRAVNIQPSNWEIAKANGGGYMQNAHYKPVHYPLKDKRTEQLGSQRSVTGVVEWNENVGEFIRLGKSAENPNFEIIYTKGKRDPLMLMNPTNHTVKKMEDSEATYYDDPDLHKEVQAKFKTILRNAASAYGIPPDLFAKDKNANKLFHALRLKVKPDPKNDQENIQINAWRKNVIKRIERGALEAALTIMHWKRAIFPHENGKDVSILSIDLMGSDLHQNGLGAIKVQYKKPANARLHPANKNSMFPDQDEPVVFIKPDDRRIEQAIFGEQNNSLAKQVNSLAGLDDQNSSITTLKMQADAANGAIIEAIKAQANEQGQNNRATPALIEGMAFSLLTGLQDLSHENVLWDDNGKPHFIDADNALVNSTLGIAKPQSGFSNQSPEAENISSQINAQANPQSGSQPVSKIIDALLKNYPAFEAALRTAFQGKKGRVVPIDTSSWTNILNNDKYPMLPDGSSENNPSGKTRWGLAKRMCNNMKSGSNKSRGLIGETGQASTEYWDSTIEAEEIKKDLDKGQVPFYEYIYDTGEVTHNGKVIWKGQSLDDALNRLKSRIFDYF